MVGQAARGL